MVFLQNVTLSLAYREAHAHHGHYFRNGIKCWQGLCPCLHTCGHTQAVTQALGQGWLGAPEELSAPPGHQAARQQAQAEITTPPANTLLPNFMKLKNSHKHLCAVISKMVQPRESRIEAG